MLQGYSLIRIETDYRFFAFSTFFFSFRVNNERTYSPQKMIFILDILMAFLVALLMFLFFKRWMSSMRGESAVIIEIEKKPVSVEDQEKIKNQSMTINEKKRRAVQKRLHDVRIPYFFKKCFRHKKYDYMSLRWMRKNSKNWEMGSSGVCFS